VHSGELAAASYETFATFNLQVPITLEGMPRELLSPELAWADKGAGTPFLALSTRHIMGLAMHVMDVTRPYAMKCPSTAAALRLAQVHASAGQVETRTSSLCSTWSLSAKSCRLSGGG